MDDCFLASRIHGIDQTTTDDALAANNARDKLPRESHWELRSAGIPSAESPTWHWNHHQPRLTLQP